MFLQWKETCDWRFLLRTNDMLFQFFANDEMEQDLKTIMLSSEDLEMEVISDNRFKEFSFDSYVRKFHLFKAMFTFFSFRC